MTDGAVCSRRRWPAWLRGVVWTGAVLVAYYGAPESLGTGTREVTGVLVTLAAVGVLGWSIVGQVEAHARDAERVRLQSLLGLFGLVVVVFASGFLVLDNSDPDQLVGLGTRTDSLYFTISTMATVGVGDIYAAGQAARALVSIQIVFDAVFVASLATTIGGEIRRRSATRAGPPGERP